MRHRILAAFFSCAKTAALSSPRDDTLPRIRFPECGKIPCRIKNVCLFSKQLKYRFPFVESLCRLLLSANQFAYGKVKAQVPWETFLGNQVPRAKRFVCAILTANRKCPRTPRVLIFCLPMFWKGNIASIFQGSISLPSRKGKKRGEGRSQEAGFAFRRGDFDTLGPNHVQNKNADPNNDHLRFGRR